MMIQDDKIWSDGGAFGCAEATKVNGGYYDEHVQGRKIIGEQLRSNENNFPDYA